MARTAKRRQEEEAAKSIDQHASASRIAWLLGCSLASVSDALSSTDIPRAKDGTMSWPEVREWAQRHGRWGYGSRHVVTSEGGENHKAQIDRYKALEAKRAYDEAMGLLIKREDAVRAQIALALEFKAALLSLPEQLSMALANLPAREVEAALRERIEWILSQSQDGKLPLPALLMEGIRKLVAEQAPANEPAA